MGDILYQRLSPQPFPEGVEANAWQRTSIRVTTALDEEVLFYSPYLSIRGRGNSSWANYDKKPFRIRFENQSNSWRETTENAVAGRNQDPMGVGFTARNWNFISMHPDKSLMRNYAAYFLGGQLNGMAFSPNAKFANVFLGGAYQGVYMITDQLDEIVNGRLLLNSSSNAALSEYLQEWCFRVPDEGDEDIDWVRVNQEMSGSPHLTNHIPFAIEFGGNTPSHTAYVREFLQNANDAIMSGDLEEIKSWIDIDSFIDFYLVMELFNCIDAGSTSLWFTIRGTGENRRLHAGPIWDFDRAAGNAYRHMGRRVDYRANAASLTRARNDWFRELFEVEEFALKANARWAEVRGQGILDNTLGHILVLATNNESNFEQNFARWNILGRRHTISPRPVTRITTFMGHIQYLTTWLSRRAVFMDGLLS